MVKDIVRHRLFLKGFRDVSETTDALRVWIDQELCTGDGLCVQYAPEVFEFDVDGLAYVKDAAGELQLAPGSRVDVPSHLRLDVIDAAKGAGVDQVGIVTEGMQKAAGAGN